MAEFVRCEMKQCERALVVDILLGLALALVGIGLLWYSVMQL